MNSKIPRGHGLARRMALALLVLAMMLAGCASGDGAETADVPAGDTEDDATDTDGEEPAADDATVTEAATATEEDAPEDSEDPTEAVAGSDPDEVGPAPQPLDEPTVVTVNQAAYIDGFSNLYAADVMGEFEKENITIEYSLLPSTDALSILAQGDGRIDVAMSSFAAAFVNAVEAGLEVGVILPSYSEVPEIPGSGYGIFMRNELIEDPSLVEGAVFGSASGAAGFTSYYLDVWLEEQGLTITDVEVRRIPTTEMPLAMEQNAIQGGYLTCPACTQVDPEVAQFVIPSTPALGTNWAGPRLLVDEPEVGEAFVRAIARATRAYLQGDYYDNPELLSRMAELMGVPEESLTAVGEYGWDPDLAFPPEEAVTGLQETWLEIGDILEVSEPVPYEDIFRTEVRDAALAG